MPACIDLKERFGDRYRVRYEESYYADRDSDRIGRHDPWLLEIPCTFGTICPWGGDDLAACVDGHPKIVTMLRALPTAAVVQDGDRGEANVRFHVDQFDTVAEIMGAYRRPSLSDEERELRRQRMILARESGRFLSQKREVGGQPDPGHLLPAST